MAKQREIRPLIKDDLDEPDELEQHLHGLTRFDDICSDNDHQLIETMIELAVGSSVVQLELPYVWHGKYRLVRYLGGGMSDVYLAEQINLADRSVVVKILPAEAVAISKQRLELFLAESQTLAKANRQNAASIVFPIDYDVFDDHPYLVMEYVAGETLVDYMRAPGDSVTEVIDIVTAAAHSLAEAHELDIVHGDIKPANMIRRPDRSLQLIDFGLSGFFNEPTRTKFGGTRRYAAPEQLSGGKVDGLTDIYCLGVVFSELLQQLPQNSVCATQRIVVDRAHELADQMTAQERNLRPSSAQEVILRLEEITKPDPPDYSRRIFVAATATSVICGTIWLCSPAIRSSFQSNQETTALEVEKATVIAWIESLRGRVKRDELGNISEVNLNDCWIANDEVAKLKIFPSLKHTMFANSKVNSVGVDLLDQPLGTLVLAGTETDDRIFPVLRKFRMTTLDLSGTKITGEGLAKLPNPDRLDSLGVADMRIADEHLEAIARMDRLRLLNLRSTKVTTVGLRLLSDLELEQVDLGHCPIEDNAIDELAKIKTLERIVLSNCQLLTNECIDKLIQIKNLTSIEISNCDFSRDQIIRLKELPRLKRLVVAGFQEEDSGSMREVFGEVLVFE